MNNRELLLSKLNGTPTDQMPWFADLSYWYQSKQISGQLPDKYQGEDGYLKLHQDMGAGIYLYAPYPVTESYDQTVVYQEKQDGNFFITTISTPIGELKSVQKFSTQTYSMGYTEHLIKKPKDLAIMRYIFEHTLFKQNYDEFSRTDQAWGHWGLPAMLPPRCTSALQLLLTRWAGVETTISLYMDAQNELEQTISHLQACDDTLYDMFARAPGTLIIFTENLDASVTGQRFMEQYEIPYWQKRIRQMRNKLVGLHNDGGVAGSLNLLSQTDFDFVEAVTPAPVGDCEIEQIKQCAQGKITIWGGIPGALFSPVYSDDFFKDFVRKLLTAFPVNSDFVLGVADQVPPDASLARVQMVRKILQDSVDK